MSDWYARRTFSSADFSPSDLARRKADLGLSVSVVLPARDEADTIEGMVLACRSLLPDLVDELVVMDGGSRDGTASIAASAGATVLQDSDVLAEFGPAQGKGDALWRSLDSTSGDIVVFVDTDIRNPDPRFVHGLLGPLLCEPDVALVKAFYDRPLQMGDAPLHPHGGGRVTELTARPLLNAFWPELAGLVQPLSGEYAGRRDLLEQLPFFTGYGVEFGMLVDTLAIHGADVISQVDLQSRIHRNQSIDALSRMAFAILQVAMQRLAASNRLQLSESLSHTYTQFARINGVVEPTIHPIQVEERPPIGSLPDRASRRSPRYNRARRE